LVNRSKTPPRLSATKPGLTERDGGARTGTEALALVTGRGSPWYYTVDIVSGPVGRWALGLGPGRISWLIVAEAGACRESVGSWELFVGT
jgi:hypothetical protein